jgi:predicted TIM-barrel fold metal-dependent hydrolase
MDAGRLTAIDVHVHAHVSDRAGSSLPDKRAMDRYFHTEMPLLRLEEIASYYRERRIACVIFTVDTELARGEPGVPNEEVAEVAAANADVMIPFASVDPGRGRAGVQSARRLIDAHGVKGFKVHPSVQEFFPNDRRAYGLYEVIAEARLPLIVHTGHTGVGAGTRGGGGVRLKYSHPMFLDDVAVDFPEMPIVMAHPSFPWQDEAISVALHKPNVYIDLSGWSPRYFPTQLIQYANTLLKEKMLFGSDFPAITPDRWLADFEKIDIRPEVRPLILKANAARLLGLKHEEDRHPTG